MVRPVANATQRAAIGQPGQEAGAGKPAPDGGLRAVIHAAEEYRHEVATLIESTVARWDPEDTSRKIELQVGRDLQFIRINGTLVGGLVGLVIHALDHG